MKAIQDLIDCTKPDRLAGTCGAHKSPQSCSRAMRIVAIKIIGWLADQHAFGEREPLELNMDYPWCQDVEMLLRPGSPLSTWFCIRETVLDFRSNVDKCERDRIRQLAHSQYHPKITAYRKPPKKKTPLIRKLITKTLALIRRNTANK